MTCRSHFCLYPSAPPTEIHEDPLVFGRDVARAFVPVPMGPRQPTELHENPCAIDVAQALRPAASRLFGTLLAASRAGAREGVFEAAALRARYFSRFLFVLAPLPARFPIPPAGWDTNLILCCAPHRRVPTHLGVCRAPSSNLPT